MQQGSALRPRETASESCQKLDEQFAEFCDIINAHETTLRDFRVEVL